MPRCEKCTDLYEEYKWYEDRFGHWKLGIKIDENLYREHICKQESIGPKKYWCFKCDAGIRYDRPCVHRYNMMNQVKEKTGLDRF